MSDTPLPVEVPVALATPANSVPQDHTPAVALLHDRQDKGSLALAVLALLGTVFMLHWASAIFIPLMLGLTFSYALRPLVDRLQALHLPRPLAAALLMTALAAGTGWTAYAISDDTVAFAESLPAVAQKIRQAARDQRRQPDTTMDKVQRAADQLEQAAQESKSGAPAAARGVTRVQIERPQFNLKDYLWASLPSVGAAVGQATAVFFITFFLLASGDTFRRKMVRLAGPTFTQKKITLQALDEITDQIQRYLLMQVLVSVLVGLATWVAFRWLQVEHAAVWGVLAFLLNFVPYIGSLLVTAGSALIGFVQFGSLDMALLVGGTSLAVHTVSGNLLMPWLTSRASRMNAVTVFVGVLAFGWLWGIWGLVLGMPILTMVKTVCDRVEHLKPIGELLGT
jgi:predicted PurR-regulated permease PerM